MGAQGRTVERELDRLATRSHGIVTRAQLSAAGITRSEIDHRLRTGALVPVHRGVFRVGYRAPSTEADYLAAVWACGEGAVLCGPAAAYLLGLLADRRPPAEVMTRTERRIPRIRTRRTRRLDALDVMTWRGIPVTTVARTLVDLAAVVRSGLLARACHEAGIHHRTTPADVEAVLRRRPTSPGAAKLRAILGGDERVTLSTLERRFLELLRETRLPLPETNRRAGGRRVDCRWPSQSLTIELDGYRFHNSRHAWEQDRRREREARARGDEFRRYTWGDVVEDPRFMLGELRALLYQGSRG